MGENCGLYLCLLDDVSLAGSLTLGEYEVRFFSCDELAGLLGGREDESVSPLEQARYALYSAFPWAVMRCPTPSGPATEFERSLRRIDLSYNHAGLRGSWWPFHRMIRNLHLMKASAGPIIPRQFYYRSEPYIQIAQQIDRVIYGEPATRSHDPDHPEEPRLAEYPLSGEDVAMYATIDEQISEWRERSQHPDQKAPLQIALAYFENADRQLGPNGLDPFQAIDPLMSYEAALEALLILDTDRGGVGETLARRIGALLDDERTELALFIKRIFWLRSKVAHGVRSPKEISRLIVDAPDEEIDDSCRNIRIPPGPYSRLYLQAPEFPGLLVNLRECTRRVIRCFLDAASRGETKEGILGRLP